MLSYTKNQIKDLNHSSKVLILRQSAEVAANTLQLLFNNAIANSEIPENLKLADVTPVFKKKKTL